MVDGMIAAAFSIAMGFVTAGICHSAYVLVTNSRLRFESDGASATPTMARTVLLMLAGPLIIVRNSWLAARAGMRPAAWLVGSAVVASAWSFCLGVAVLNVVVIIGA